MANAREIQSRINSVKDTMKITNAMYMISSSNLKKAKKNLQDTEPYFYTLQGAIQRILRHLPDLDNFYFQSRPQIPAKERKKDFIVVTADKGLAGAYNHNVITMAEEAMAGCEHVRLCVLGELGRTYFAKHKVNVDSTFLYTVQNPTMNRARNIAERTLDLFNSGQVDEVYLIYTQMINSISTEAQMVKLLPLERAKFSNTNIPADVPQEELTFFPSEDGVMDNIVPNYIAGLIYGALVESFASEQNSRMMAMQAATDNAKEMLRQLNISYNRVRQAAITQEITEVIAGAKSQKNKKKQ